MEKKEELVKKPLGHLCPTVGHIHVTHPTSSVERGSRYCINEADAIIEWLLSNYHFIRKTYTFINPSTRQLEYDNNTIVIITPFQAQREIIHAALKAASMIKGYSEIVNIPCISIYELLMMNRRNPIIIFSTVYGADEDWGFIRQCYDVINVAFSWAKDYFFTFGERNVRYELRKYSLAVQNFFDCTFRVVPDSLERIQYKERSVGNNTKVSLHNNIMMRDILINLMRQSDINVNTDSKEGQRILDNRTSLKEEKKAPDEDCEVF